MESRLFALFFPSSKELITEVLYIMTRYLASKVANR